MSEFTLWGLLSKAQDNVQTIDEAIADAISTHNDDPIAHLGTGRSLEAHKTNETLDHPAISVVPDKLQSNLFSYFNSFVAPTTYDASGTSSQGGLGLIGVAITSGQHSSSIVVPVQWLEGRSFPVEGFLADMIFSWSKIGATLATAIIACGDDYDGFGFSLNATGWRAFYAIAGSITYSDYIAISQEVMHKVRLICDPLENKFIVIFDGVKIIDMSLAEGSDAMTYQWSLWADWVSGPSNGFLGLQLYTVSLNVG